MEVGGGLEPSNRAVAVRCLAKFGYPTICGSFLPLERFTNPVAT